MDINETTINALPDKRRRIAEINRKLVTVAVLELPGTVLFGLGLYALFAGDEPFWPPLADTPVIAALLIVGGAIMAWGSLRLLALLRELQRLGAAPPP